MAQLEGHNYSSDKTHLLTPPHPCRDSIHPSTAQTQLDLFQVQQESEEQQQVVQELM